MDCSAWKVVFTLSVLSQYLQVVTVSVEYVLTVFYCDNILLIKMYILIRLISPLQVSVSESDIDIMFQSPTAMSEVP